MSRPLLPFLLIGLAATFASCATTGPEDSPIAKTARKHWRPSSAGLGDWVWIRLDTDEWLKGRIIVLRQDSLEFESDNLGKITIDWDDVTELYSKRQNEFLFNEDEQFTGAVSMVDNVVTVTEYRGVQHVYPRDELFAIVPAGSREVDRWSGKASVGVGFRSGNVDQADFSSDVDIARRTLETRYKVTYLGNYSEVNEDVAANSHRINTNFDVFLTWALFITPVTLEFYRDPIVNIRYQITPGTGIGYTIIDQSKITWEVNTGIGYQYTEYMSVQEGEDRTEGQTSVSFGTTLEYEITGNLDFDFSHSVMVGVPDTERWSHHLQARLSFEITDDIDFDVTLIWDRNDTTILDEDGVPPEEHDLHFTVGLGVDF